MNSQNHGYIMGIGGFLPKEVIKTSDLLDEAGSERFGIPISFIERRIGIIEKRKVDDDWQPSDLAIAAGRIAIEGAGISPGDIDCIIFCAIEGDWKEPATAHRVQHELEAVNAICFDVSNACNGFMSGLYIADSLIAAGRIETALVVTGEKNSPKVNNIMKLLKSCRDSEFFRNRVGAFTMGDAGGAVVVAKSSNGVGFINFNSMSKGQYTKMCYYNYDEHGNIAGEMIMNPIAPTMKILESEMIEKTFKIMGWSPENVDCVVSHQIGRKYHVQVAELVGVPVEKTTKTYDVYGNLATATIPVNLFLYPPVPGSNYLLIGGGAGISIYHAGLRV